MKVIIGIGIAILALLCVGGIAIGAGLVLSNQAPTATDLQAMPPLQRLAAQATGNDDMIVTISERYLNRKMTQGSPQDSQVSNVRLDLHAGNIANVYATVQINALLTVQPNATVQFSVSNGRMQIKVQQVQVGGFGVPSNLVERQIAELQSNAETQLNQQLAEVEKGAGLKPSAVSTTENSLTLYFAP
ncbi:MAG: hypothetical protein HY741_24090 [Chloroflexi bacterium]|nr:hypothetical protein [Chloroflexota bacterium]